MRRAFAVLWILLALAVPLRAQEKALDAGMAIAGKVEKVDRDINLGGSTYAHYLTSPDLDAFAVFDIRGWDHFTAWIGIPGTVRTRVTQKTAVEVDGAVVWQGELAAGQPAQFVAVPLKGKSTLVLRWQAPGTAFAEAKLFKGELPPQFACPLCPVQCETLEAITQHITTVHVSGTTPPPGIAGAVGDFAVNPDDLEALAAALRRRVDEKADLQVKLADSITAVTRFSTLGITSPTVAQTLAADLAAHLQHTGLRLVAHARFDAAWQKLNLPHDAPVDEAVAKQLSELTGCAFLLTGSISDRGQTVAINTRLLEIATNRVVAAERVEGRKIAAPRPGANIHGEVFFSSIDAFCAKPDIQSAVDFVSAIDRITGKAGLALDGYLRIAESCYKNKRYNEAVCIYEFMLAQYAAGHFTGDRQSLLAYRCATTYYREGLADPKHSAYLQNSIVKYLDFVKQYPDHELCDDALYWTANAFVKLGNPQQAYNMLHWQLTEYKDGDMLKYAERFAAKIREDNRITTATKIQVPEYVEIPRTLTMSR